MKQRHHDSVTQDQQWHSLNSVNYDVNISIMIRSDARGFSATAELHFCCCVAAANKESQNKSSKSATPKQNGQLKRKSHFLCCLVFFYLQGGPKKQGCRGYGNSHGNSHGYGYGMGMGTVMNSHGDYGNSVGIFEWL